MQNIMLLPAATSDLPTLSKIQAAAYQADLVSYLMNLGRDEDWSYVDWLRRSTEPLFFDPMISFVKAVDNSNGQTVGWSCWAVKELLNEDNSMENLKEGTAKVWKEADEKKTKLPRQILSALIAKEYTHWYTKYMAGSKHLVLQGLFVSPMYQGRGIGTALINQGVERADADGLSCWVHASPASYGVYKKAGFEQVGATEFYLDEWAPGGKGGDRGWGKYTFRYMLRSRCM